MRTTINDVKFDEESKFELIIGLQCKGKLENAEYCGKIIKLLVEKNDVEKYLVTNDHLKEHQKRPFLAPGRCPQTRERFSHNGFSELTPFFVPIGANLHRDRVQRKKIHRLYIFLGIFWGSQLQR